MPIHSGIAANLDQHILTSALPLFQAGDIEAIEWSFDALFNHRNIPHWFVELLKAFANEQRLIGHGVFFSVFRASWSEEQQRWLNHLKKVNNYFQFDHVSEHFGFMTGENFHNGAPLSLPLNNTTLEIGYDRLSRISEVVNCPIGLENLAFAYSKSEVQEQGSFLDSLLEKVNGFIILDLHNIYCQSYNFQEDITSLINSYPLARVREIHLSGGSFEPSYSSNSKLIRRDTHNDTVPIEVFSALEYVIPHCTNLKYVMLEQVGRGLKSPEQKLQFQVDFNRMKRIVKHAKIDDSSKSNSFIFNPNSISKPPLEHPTLFAEQQYLSTLLEDAVSVKSIQKELREGRLNGSEWKVEQWNLDMLATAYAIAQKWK